MSVFCGFRTMYIFRGPVRRPVWGPRVSSPVAAPPPPPLPIVRPADEWALAASIRSTTWGRQCLCKAVSCTREGNWVGYVLYNNPLRSQTPSTDMGHTMRSSSTKACNGVEGG